MNIYFVNYLWVLILEPLNVFNGFVEHVMIYTTRTDLRKTYRGQQCAVVEGNPHPSCSLETAPTLSKTGSISVTQEGICIKGVV